MAVTDDEAPQTAMLLTEREWQDLAEICSQYRECPPRRTSREDAVRQWALCKRIMEAAE